MFDFDSDGDNAGNGAKPIYEQTADWTEGFDTNGNGEAADEIVSKARKFAIDNPGKADYYAIATTGRPRNSAFLQDSDGDKIPNFLDNGSPFYKDDNFNGLVDLYDPAYGGSPSTAPLVGGTGLDALEAIFRSKNKKVPLPVTLVSFSAQASGLNAQLNWKTAQELNNDHFVVERSFDGRGFVAVGQVKGQGSTQSATTYDFTDARVAALAPAGLVYYRLRQVDTDGTAALSEVQAVRFAFAASKLIDVRPNPATATQDAKLDLSGASAGTYQVTLVDMTGRVLRTFRQNGGTVEPLQLTSLPTGTYLVQVKGNGQSFSQRVIKQ
nr:T9SS type A sorting domain-containing protein [Hymenobacter sp. ISL-91]